MISAAMAYVLVISRHNQTGKLLIAVTIFAAVVAVVGLITFAIRAILKRQQESLDGLHVVLAEMPAPPVRSRNGKKNKMPPSFKITGIDRDTRMDTTWHVKAESEANARVKAELEGIIVTEIEID
jgi:hypothetical protein